MGNRLRVLPVPFAHYVDMALEDAMPRGDSPLPDGWYSVRGPLYAGTFIVVDHVWYAGPMDFEWRRQKMIYECEWTSGRLHSHLWPEVLRRRDATRKVLYTEKHIRREEGEE